MCHSLARSVGVTRDSLFLSEGVLCLQEKEQVRARAQYERARELNLDEHCYMMKIYLFRAVPTTPQQTSLILVL